MKSLKPIIFLIFLLAGTHASSFAAGSGPLRLKDIFSKANAIESLSYQTQITSPAGGVKKFRVWIHGDHEYIDGYGIKLKQVGEKSYFFLHGDWMNSPGLSINTAIRFLKQAQESKDTKIIGQESIDGENTTVIEYTQTQPDWSGLLIKIKLWISHKNFIPLKIEAKSITQKKIQTEIITDVSFKANEHETFLREIERIKTARRRAEQKWEPWQREREQGYRKMLRIEAQENLTATQKADAWEDFLATLTKNNPYSSADEKMRFQAKSRIPYCRFISRYSSAANGIVADSQTGLEWLAGPDKDTNWQEAQSWIEGLDVDGSGWRMPTVNELKTLYHKGAGNNNMSPFFNPAGTKTGGGIVWSGETRNKVSTWCLSYAIFKKYANNNKVSKNMRAFAVRSQ